MPALFRYAEGGRLRLNTRVAMSMFMFARNELLGTTRFTLSSHDLLCNVGHLSACSHQRES